MPRSLKIIYITLAYAALAAAFLFLVFNPHLSSEGVAPLGGEVWNRVAPPLSLTDPAGTMVGLDRLKGKTTLVHFWASWCAPCVDELPSLSSLANQLAPRGLKVVAISVDESWDQVRRVVPNLKDNIIYLLDPSRRSSSAFGTMKFPETYLVDPSGIIRLRFVGPRDWSSPEAIRAIVGLLREGA